MLPAMRGKLGVVMASVLVVSCSGGHTTYVTPSARPPSAATATSASPSATAAPIACQPAPAALVQLINAAFTDGEQLDHPAAVNGPNDATYIAGDITKAKEVVSHADVWLSQHGALFALSSDARKRTILADGRDIAYAGDEYGSAAQACIGR